MQIGPLQNLTYTVRCMLCTSCYDCPVMSVDAEGNTPLHMAAAKGFAHIAILLLR